MKTPFAWIAVGLVALVLVGLAAGAVPVPREPLPVSAARTGGANDAGSGGDAGDSQSSALLVTAASHDYRGALTPPTSDRDWFRLGGAPNGPAFCARGVVSSPVASRAALSAHSDRPYEVTADVAANTEVQLAFATPAGDGLWLGIEPVLSAMSTTDGSTSPQTGPTQYRFSLQAPDVRALDPDAEGSTPGAKVLDSPCFAGRLDPMGGDATDEWLLQTTSARTGTFSLAKAADLEVAMDLYTPTGALRATIRSGDIVRVDLDENGWWRLVVRADAPATTLATRAPVGLAAVAATSGEYIVGLTTGDPWCRPSCR